MGSARTFLACLLAVALAAAGPWGAAAPILAWTRQVGTSSDDRSYGVSADGLGNLYISGFTFGSLGGPNAGSNDAFLTKYDSAGTLLWSRQVGTGANDLSYGVSADGLGNVYISGFTFGSLGGPNAGLRDALLVKYDAAGTLQWSRQVGTAENEVAYGVSADGLGNVYISGYTRGSLGGPNAGNADPFLTKYDAAGTLQWSRQAGTASDDYSYGVSADGSGNVYISGHTTGSLGGPNAGLRDAFLTKYDSAGTLLWSRQVGTAAWDESCGVSADGLGNVYISGDTLGSLGGPNAGSYDAFLTKYDAAGTLLWSRQVGTAAWDESYGVSADGLGNVYISGYTGGSLGGPNAGSYDAFLTKYDSAGTLQWSRQVGTPSDDRSRGVSTDGSGNVYISGPTLGSLGGPNAGGEDAFLASYGEPILATSPAQSGTLQFGSVLVGQTGTQSLSATNSGGVGSQLNGTFPDASGDFAPGSSSAFGPLAQGASTSRDYTYSPASRGADSLGITVTSDGGNSTVTLSGTGVAPLSQVPNTLAIAYYTLVGQSQTALLVVNNIGDGNLSGQGAASNLNGTAPATVGEFTLSGSTSISIADGGSRTLSYVYTPASRGADDLPASLSFDNGKPDGTNAAHSVGFTLSGRGVAPVSQVPNTLANAGFVLVGESGTAALVLNNIGDGSLSGMGAASNLNGTAPGTVGEFALSGSTSISLPDSLVGSGTMTLSYSYAPASRGLDDVATSLSFTNGKPDGTNAAHSVDFTLRGRGVAPLSQVPNTLVDAGYVLVGQSGTASLAVNNIGDGNLSGRGPVSNLNGSAPPVVGEFSTPLVNMSLQDGESRVFTYTYTPASRGLDDLGASLSFMNGKPDGTNAAHSVGFTLRGQGVAPQQQTVLLNNAGLVRIGTSGTARIGVTNQGDGNLSGLGAVSNLRGNVALLPGSPPEFTGGTPVNLADAASQTFPYTYTPTAHGPQQATVRADFLNGSSDGRNLAEILDVLITGEGVGPVFESSTPPGGTIDFGAVILGGNALRQLLVSNATIDPNGGNLSLTNLTLLAADISGPNASLFSLIGFTPGTVLGEGVASFFDISFSALGPVGDKEGTLTFTTDQGAALGEDGATFAFELRGTVSDIPEPTTMALLLGGIAALGRRRGRKLPRG
ncbi:MAG: choice-of-anchor D domain-containing protein [Planctomycetes bacterium]|nr:choice-of-anchor D domain-containing protein [Planctomycetota bacterium]